MSRVFRLLPPAFRCFAAGLLALCACAAPLRAQDGDSVAAGFHPGPEAAARIARAAETYRKIAAGGGWPAVPPGPALRAGDRDARIPLLRRRLAATGDLEPAPTTSETGMDAPVVAAVRRFQARHGLAADGIVGPRTRAALNASARARAEALSLNRGRVAALVGQVGHSAVVVNIPAAELVLLRDGRPALYSRAVVGLPSWPTPQLDGRITRLEINPYWIVPASIVRREMMPLLLADPEGYLAANDMRVLSGPPGALVEAPPDSVDWSRFGARGYRLRQDPGPDNPLGRIKFVFANGFDVFLHDTPGRAAFARDRRALSHGCVRVERAFELAAALLAGQPGWDADALRAAIDAGERRVVPLTLPAEVHLVYVTAWVDGQGRAQFRPDLYGIDRRAARASAAQPCGPPA